MRQFVSQIVLLLVVVVGVVVFVQFVVVFIIDGVFFVFFVSDFDEVMVWYVENFGFQVDLLISNDECKVVLFLCFGVLFELVEFVMVLLCGVNLLFYEVYGFFKFGFIVLDLNEMFCVFEECGVEIFFLIVEVVDRWWIFGVKDFEGNIVQFFGKQWMESYWVKFFGF